METPRAKPLGVIVADDAEGIRLSIIKRLTEAFGDHIQILEADDGEEAWSMFMEYQIAAVVSDHSMLSLDGFQLLVRVRKSGHDTPFVLLTGRNDPELKKAVEQYHATFLSKEAGLDEGELVAWLRTTLGL